MNTPLAIHRPSLSRLALAMLFFGSCMQSGCGNDVSDPQSAAAPAQTATAAGTGQFAEPGDSAVAAQEMPEPAPLDAEQIWSAIYMQGSKIGHMQTQIVPLDDDGESRIRTTGTMQMSVTRFGQTITQQMSFGSVESAAGQLRSFTSEMQLGPVPLKTQGEVQSGRLLIQTSTAGKTQTDRLDWQADWGGYFAPELSLRRRPMQPGEARSLRHLKAPFNIAGETRLEAEQVESTELLSGEKQLLKIRSHEEIGETAIDSILWCDSQGRIWKQSTPSLQQVFYRTTREQAEGRSEAADLGLRVMVPVARRLSQPHDTTRIVYHAHLPQGDPSRIFPNATGQTVTAIDAHTAEIVVRAVRGGQGDQPSAGGGPAPGAEYLQPNNFVQSDDAEVIKLARAAAHDSLSGAELACALERHVHEAVREKNFSQALATAADVARSREGDCTEHAVLLAALCRARRLPARVAIGLVYYAPRGGEPGFAYHMWTEAWVDDDWLPLDATLGQCGIGAAHVKLADSSLQGADAWLSYLQVNEVLGKLQLEIQQVQP